MAFTPRRIALLFVFLATGVLWGQIRMIPHLTRDGGGFVTNVFLENRAVTSRNYVLVPYDSAGNELERVEGSLEGQTSIAFAARDLFPGDAEASHFTIEGDDIRVTAAYQAENAGSPAHVTETEVQASRYRIFAGNWDEVFDGFAVVNTGMETADVWVAQRAFSGEIVQSVRAIDDLAPFAKGLYVIGSPAGSAFEPRDDTYYQVYATQGLAITALRGNQPGALFLWTNQAEARGQAETTRDAQGVWFIEGGTFYDVMEAMGYNVATDRLWQAETFRRLGRGTLAEVFGTPFLNLDILTRSTSYSDEEYVEGYANLDPESQISVKAYVDGFNRRIAEVHADPALQPFELVTLGLLPLRDWTPTDVLAWLTSLLRSFDPNNFAEGQMSNAEILQILQNRFPASANAMFDDLVYVNDPDAPTMIPNLSAKTVPTVRQSVLPPLRDDIDFRALAKEMRERNTHRRQLLESINAFVKMGSYAWVVSGDRTDSGNPVIYSGPQMGFATPSIIGEGSIRGGGLEISGMFVPGLPGIVIGRTPHHAWSMQVGHAHSADLYIEPPEALADGPHHSETIKVRGLADVNLEVFRTENGPLIHEDPVITWKYAHWGREFDTIAAFLKLAKAQSMDEFGEGVEMAALSQHFCYADRDGNIAYWMSGYDPVRPAGEYRLPQGSVGQPLVYDAGVRKPLAHDRNTAQGYYGGWNNKARADYDNAPFGGFLTFGPAHRVQAILDILGSKDTFTFEEIRDIAIDIAATDSFGAGGNLWSYVSGPFTAAVAANPTPERDAAIEILQEWDGHFVDGGEDRWVNGTDRADAWVLMDAWIRQAIVLTFADELGGPPSQDNQFGLLFNTMLHGLDLETTLTNQYDWFSNAADPTAPQTSEAIIVQALDDTLAALGNRPWGTGTRGTIDYIHDVLMQSLSTTPFGSRSTYAHCVEMGPDGLVRIESMFPLGQSGNLYGTGGFTFQMDANYLSMQEFFNNFTPRSFPIFP